MSMTRSELPRTDEQISNMLAGNQHVPVSAVAYPNWHNKYVTLADDLKSAFREDGIAGLRDETLVVAKDVCEEVLDERGLDREPTPNEIVGTAVNTVAIPATTRNAFVRGAIAEIRWENHLTEMGYEVLTAEEVEEETGVNAYQQERSKGWDVTARKNGELTHFQVKATSDEPDIEKRKDADALIWYEVDDGEMLTPEEVRA